MNNSNRNRQGNDQKEKGQHKTIVDKLLHREHNIDKHCLSVVWFEEGKWHAHFVGINQYGILTNHQLVEGSQ